MKHLLAFLLLGACLQVSAELRETEDPQQAPAQVSAELRETEDPQQALAQVWSTERQDQEADRVAEELRATQRRWREIDERASRQAQQESDRWRQSWNARQQAERARLDRLRADEERKLQLEAYINGIKAWRQDTTYQAQIEAAKRIAERDAFAQAQAEKKLAQQEFERQLETDRARNFAKSLDSFIAGIRVLLLLATIAVVIYLKRQQ